MKEFRKKAAQVTGQRRFFSGGFRNGEDSDLEDSSDEESNVRDPMPERYLNPRQPGTQYLSEPESLLVPRYDVTNGQMPSQGAVDGAAFISAEDALHPAAAEVSPRKTGLLRPIRKFGSRITGAQGFFSGKGAGSGAEELLRGNEFGPGGKNGGVEQRSSSDMPWTRLGYQQALYRLEANLEAYRSDQFENESFDGQFGTRGARFCCCMGMLAWFLGPLRQTAAGSDQMQRLKDIVPWFAIALMGFAIGLNILANVLLVSRRYMAYTDDEAVDDSMGDHSDKEVTHHLHGIGEFFGFIFTALAGFIAFITYFVCWLLGLRIACASSGAPRLGCCATHFQLPLWHRLLASVPVLGLSVLVCYAPWLMLVTTGLTIVPQYFIHIVYCLTYKTVEWFDVFAGITAALVMVLTPAHIIVSISLRNDVMIGRLRRTVQERATRRRSAPAPASLSSVQYYSQISSRNGYHQDVFNNTIVALAGSDRGRSVSFVYRERLWNVFAVIAAPMLLDLCQCIPLLGAYYFLGDIKSKRIFIALLIVFFLPRMLLFAISIVKRRISFDIERGIFVLSSFDHVRLLSHLMGTHLISSNNGMRRRKRQRGERTNNVSTSDELKEDLEQGSHIGRGRHHSVEAGRVIDRAEATTASPLGHGIIRGRNIFTALLCILFPLTPSLFLILDNLAKIAATSSGDDEGIRGGGGSDRNHDENNDDVNWHGNAEENDDTSTVDDSEGCGCECYRDCRDDLAENCCCCCSCCNPNSVDAAARVGRWRQHQRSDEWSVPVGLEDRCNARLYTLTLLVAYWSQVYVLFCGDGVLREMLIESDSLSMGHEHRDARAGLAIMVLVEALFATGLSIAVNCALGGAVWRRVRVIFANRASLWLSAAGLERTGGLVVYGLPRKSRDHVNSGEGGCGSMQGQQSLHQREASGREGNTDAFTPPGSINQSISNGEAGTSGPGTSKQGKWWSISPKRTARRGNNRHTVAAAIGRTPTAVARPIPTAQTAVTVLQPQPAAAATAYYDSNPVSYGSN